jgi:indole-3-glycerol phosphate synthase
MNSILNKIIEKIREEEKNNFLNFPESTDMTRRKNKPVNILPLIKENFFFIAEVKKGSPSKGIIRENFDHLLMAKEYERGGASAISVITEKNFFFGAKEYLTEIKEKTKLPILRKDFIIDPYQVYESFKLGADFILLIAACLKESELKHLYELAMILGLNVLVEVHSTEDLEKALNIKPAIIGINNRDLNTFDVSMETSFNLKKMIPDNIHVISESGIKSNDDIKKLKDCGFSGALIGESLLRRENLTLALRSLING